MRQEEKSITCIGSKVRKWSVEVKLSYFTTITVLQIKTHDHHTWSVELLTMLHMGMLGYGSKVTGGSVHVIEVYMAKTLNNV